MRAREIQKIERVQPEDPINLTGSGAGKNSANQTTTTTIYSNHTREKTRIRTNEYICVNF